MDSLIIRKLNLDDYHQYFKLINDFRETNFSKDQFVMIMDKISDYTAMWVIELDGNLIACATILYEYKFIHDIGKVGHVEDVCVGKEFRGKGYGKILIDHLVNEAKLNDCYKIILDCKEDLNDFYGKSGFEKNGIQMSIYY
jgi:glucosamine-phosphate N-acetyltransferase